MPEPPVLMEKRDDGVALITLNRPERMNTMSAELLPALGEALHDCAVDGAVRCLALTGAGRAFSAGGDVKDMAADIRAVTFGGDTDEAAAAQLARAAQATTGAIYALPKPVVALINGFVVGGSLGLALACDIRLAAEGARLGTAFRNVGLSGDFGTTYLLPRIVGSGRAREMFLSGEMVDAKAALAIGLVSRVYPAEDLLPDGLAYCAAIAQGPTRALGRMKANLAYGEGHSLARTIEREALNQRFSALDDDHAGAARAFANKENPVFRGR